MKKILVIAECINKNKTSQGIGTTSFLNALAHGAFQIDCCYYEHVQHEIYDTSHINKNINLIKIRNTPLDQIIQFLRPLRNLSIKYFGVNLLRKRRIARFKKVLKPILKRKKYDIVFVRTIAGSIASHVAILELSKTISFNWVANFNDPVPITMMPYPYFDGNIKFPKSVIKDENLVKDIVRKCDGITSPSVKLTKLFLSFAGIKPGEKRVYRFPHIFVEQNTVTPSFLDTSKFNLVHPGSLLKPRNPEFLLKAYQKLIKKHPDIKNNIGLTFFGNIHNSHNAIFDSFEFPELLHIKNTRLPHDEALGVLQESDVLIILEAVSEESPFMPGKLAEFIGLEKMILALSPLKSETRRILGEGYPYQSKANDIDDIYNHLNKLYNKWSSNQSLKLEDTVLKKYVSYIHVIEEMNKIINDLK